MRFAVLAAIGLVFAAPASQALAEDVVVDGAHVCCGACIRGINKALGGVEGVSNVSCERKGGKITYKAENAKSAAAGLAALAKAGFFGKARIGDKAAEFPGGSVKKGTKADEVTLITHLCCGGCVRAAANAVKGINGVEGTSRKRNNFTITGKQFDVSAVIAALNKAGFNARIPKKK